MEVLLGAGEQVVSSQQGALVLPPSEAIMAQPS